MEALREELCMICTCIYRADSVHNIQGRLQSGGERWSRQKEF